MGEVNYNIRYQVLRLELDKEISKDPETYAAKWSKFLAENEKNRHTVYDNRLVVRDILKRLMPHSRIVGKQLLITAEFSELLKALEGFNL